MAVAAGVSVFAVAIVAPPKEKADFFVGEELFCAVLVVVVKAYGFGAVSVGPLNVLLVAILPNTLAD